MRRAHLESQGDGLFGARRSKISLELSFRACRRTGNTAELLAVQVRIAANPAAVLDAVSQTGLLRMDHSAAGMGGAAEPSVRRHRVTRQPGAYPVGCRWKPPRACCKTGDRALAPAFAKFAMARASSTGPGRRLLAGIVARSAPRMQIMSAAGNAVKVWGLSQGRFDECARSLAPEEPH